MLLIPIILMGQTSPFAEKAATSGLRTGAGNTGVAVADFDNDGWDDIFISNIPYPFIGNDTTHSLLFRNNHDGTFSNITKQAGLWVYGGYKTSLWADVNNDGYPDLFMASDDGQGSSHLFINNKNGTFKDVTATSGIDSMALVATASFGDYNNDGKIDLLLATEGNVNLLLYKNISTKDSTKFIEVSQQSYLAESIVPMQVTFIDYDHDGNQDIYIVHDGTTPSLLYHNNGNERFTEVSATTGLRDVGVGNSMGVYWADFDGDGWEDVYVTRIRKGGMYRCQQNGTYQNIAAVVGAEKNGMSWGLVCEDFDNDGDIDMFIVNSYGYDLTRSLYYENNNGVYSDKAADYGIDYPIDFFGVACADFNNDGYLDIFAPAINGENKFLVNTKVNKGNWAKIKLYGVTVNTMAIGVRVRIVADGHTYIRSVTAGNGFISQMSQVLHFGLGAATVIDTMEIFWKKNYVQRFTQQKVNTTYLLTEGETPVTSVDNRQHTDRPLQFLLAQNYPNPFNPSTVISYQLPVNSAVTLKLFDVLGREIATLVNEQQYAGSHNFQLSIHNFQLSSGVYFYQLRSQKYSETKKMVVLQ
ncbi:MAG: FG-GAP-like repeat-containing protein [Bacteroidota bacterium]|nr:FG-GAP-like repeat-containing protein [Bacteroidota bacterium]